ncbi:inward rectifier K channel (IRK-C) family protein [Thraustotheca clavata]|uniref:Inward rectifier K channel (IRK-C) family protein n=1 Tax=Thraustotheca clavata TaxID=74557 RepID=A0A1W0A635_9STRA|nr:inward rectifier K channel (IRK-C) family protein [Thraustotheca clavata]
MEKAHLLDNDGFETHQVRARLVDRCGQFTPRRSAMDPMSQGSYKYAILNMIIFIDTFSIQRIGGNWRQIYFDDFFHTVINTRTIRIVAGIISAYALVIFFFALAFRKIAVSDTTCNVGLSSLMEAYIFSVETIMTIGYGAPTSDILYGGCKSMAILLTLESFSGIFLNCICVGMFFVRFARATKRANSIIFTQSAVIRRIRGQYYFMFQLCERRKHQLQEAHVRCYAFQHGYSDDINEQICDAKLMRLQQPDDDIGAYLLMVLPQVVIHRIDQWSPLYPPECRPKHHESSTIAGFADPPQRAIDHENGNRDYNDLNFKLTVPTEQQLRRHIEQSELEVVVILEGQDSTTSNTMQARYSYTTKEIKWHAMFEKCVTRRADGGALIDYDKFHLLKPAPVDTSHVATPSIF